MPSLSDLPGGISRKKFERALERAGFFINRAGGNGSHYKATWPATQKSLTILKDLPKQVLKYLLKEIEHYSNGKVNWDVIKELL